MTPGGNNDDHGIISTLNSNMGNGFFLCIWRYSGNVDLGFGIIDPNNGRYEVIHFDSIPIGSWHHYVFDVFYNSGNPIFNRYLDGVSLIDNHMSLNYGFSPSNTPRNVLVFGNMYADNPDSYMPSAIIDEVLLFNYTLSPSDVAILFGIY